MDTRLDRHLTARDLDDLPHEWDTVYELIGGVLHMARRPSHMHQEILGNLLEILRPAARAAGGSAVQEPGLLWEEDGDDNVSPDLAVVLGAKPPRGSKLRRCPEIVVEVLSPGAENRRRDLEAKRDLYWRRGGTEYWIVDPEEETVLRLCRSERDWVEERLGRDDMIRTPLLPAWKGVPVAALFAGVTPP